MQKNNRIQYIDALRGFTMLLVVYGHICTKLVAGIGESSTVTQIIALFRMPLFFFISGFFVYSVSYNWTLYKRRMYNRLRMQLFPTIIFWILFCVCFAEVTIVESLADHFKSGYWFTFVAVELFLLYSPMFLFFSTKNFGTKKRNIYLALYTAALLSIGFIGDRFLHWSSTAAWGVLSLSDMFLYIPYFYLGIFFRMNSTQVLNYLSNKYFVIACLILFVASLALSMNFLVHILCAVAGIVIIHYVFWAIFRKKRVQDSKFSHFLEYVGTMTLEIYLLHYFIIEGLKRLPGLTFFGSLKNTALEIPIYMLCSLGITSICLAIVYLMKRIGIYNFTFPKAKKILPSPTSSISSTKKA